MVSDIMELAQKIRLLKSMAEELMEESKGIPALRCNLRRVLASARILELDICDISSEGAG